MNPEQFIVTWPYCRQLKMGETNCSIYDQALRELVS